MGNISHVLSACYSKTDKCSRGSDSTGLKDTEILNSVFVLFAYLNGFYSICVLDFSQGTWAFPWENSRHDVGIGVKGQDTKCLRGVKKASRMIDCERKKNILNW